MIFIPFTPINISFLKIYNIQLILEPPLLGRR
jgi:hypothetical protein